LLDADQLSVGVVTWLVAPLPGEVRVTWPGTEPADLKVRITDAQMAPKYPESKVALAVPLKPVRVFLSSTSAKLAKNGTWFVYPEPAANAGIALLTSAAATTYSVLAVTEPDVVTELTWEVPFAMPV